MAPEEFPVGYGVSTFQAEVGPNLYKHEHVIDGVSVASANDIVTRAWGVARDATSPLIVSVWKAPRDVVPKLVKSY